MKGKIDLILVNIFKTVSNQYPTIKMIQRIRLDKKFVSFSLIEDVNAFQGPSLNKIDWLIFKNYNTRIFVKNLESKWKILKELFMIRCL